MEQKMKRVRSNIPQESEATRKGLAIKQAQRDGFNCECGTHYEFSSYVLAHWSMTQQHRCQVCGRVHKLAEGVVSLISGPNKKAARVMKKGADELLDPNVPLWRCYHLFNNGPRPSTYSAATDYHPSLGGANDQAWDYVNRVHPNSRSRATELFRALIRAEEYPLLSTVAVDGRIVGAGNLQSVGHRVDKTRGGIEVVEFELRDLKGRVTRVSLLPEVWRQIADDLEYERKPAEKSARPPERNNKKLTQH
jgi:hypothetical protein